MSKFTSIDDFAPATGAQNTKKQAATAPASSRFSSIDDFAPGAVREIAGPSSGKEIQVTKKPGLLSRFGSSLERLSAKIGDSIVAKPPVVTHTSEDGSFTYTDDDLKRLNDENARTKAIKAQNSVIGPARAPGETITDPQKVKQIVMRDQAGRALSSFASGTVRSVGSAVDAAGGFVLRQEDKILDRVKPVPELVAFLKKHPGLKNALESFSGITDVSTESVRSPYNKLSDKIKADVGITLENQTYVEKVAESFGASTPALLLSLATGGTAGAVLGGGLEGAQEAQGVYDTIMQESGDMAKADKAAAATFATNALLNIVTDKFGYLSESAQGPWKKYITSVLLELGQEDAQQVIANIATGRPWSEGLEETTLLALPQTLLMAGAGTYATHLNTKAQQEEDARIRNIVTNGVPSGTPPSGPSGTAAMPLITPETLSGISEDVEAEKAALTPPETKAEVAAPVKKETSQENKKPAPEKEKAPAEEKPQYEKPKGTVISVDGTEHLLSGAAEKRYLEAKERSDAYIKQSKNRSNAGAVAKAEGFQMAALKRELTGQYTTTEISNKFKQERSNYQGKQVDVMIGDKWVEGTIQGKPSYGKFKVMITDGTLTDGTVVSKFANEIRDPRTDTEIRDTIMNRTESQPYVPKRIETKPKTETKADTSAPKGKMTVGITSAQGENPAADVTEKTLPDLQNDLKDAGVTPLRLETGTYGLYFGTPEPSYHLEIPTENEPQALKALAKFAKDNNQHSFITAKDVPDGQGSTSLYVNFNEDISPDQVKHIQESFNSRGIGLTINQKTGEAYTHNIKEFDDMDTETFETSVTDALLALGDQVSVKEFRVANSDIKVYYGESYDSLINQQKPTESRVPARENGGETQSGPSGEGNLGAVQSEGSGTGGKVVRSPSQATTREPNPAAITASEEYNASKGLPPVNHDVRVKVDVDFAKKTAMEYEKLKDDNSADPEVAKAFNALKDELLEQWNFLVDQKGVSFEPWDKEGQPYANSAEMMADVRDNGHLYYFTGGEPHAFLDAKAPNGVTYNEMLRAIHDYFGHAAAGNTFSATGEENAWLAHSQMFSPDAQRALTTETRGQNSWVNYGPQNYEGDIYKNIPASERPYAAQKVDLLPVEFSEFRSKLPTVETPVQEPIISTVAGRKEAQLNPVGEGESAVSSLYDNVKDRLEKEAANNDVEYNVATRDVQIKKAVDFVTEYPERAERIVQGRELVPEGILKNDIMTAVREQLLSEGRFAEAADVATRQSLQSTRYGQEIQALRGSTDPDSFAAWIDTVSSGRMQGIAKRLVYEFKNKKKRVVAPEKAIKTAVDEGVKEVKDILTKEQVKIAQAQKIIDMLTC